MPRRAEKKKKKPVVRFQTYNLSILTCVPLTRLHYTSNAHNIKRPRRPGEKRAAVIIILWEEQGPANERPIQTILRACVSVTCIWIFFHNLYESTLQLVRSVYRTHYESKRFFRTTKIVMKYAKRTRSQPGLFSRVFLFAGRRCAC